MIDPVLLIVIPLFLAFASVLLKSYGRYLMYIAALLNAVFAFFAAEGTTVIGGFKPPFGISLIVDDYSAVGIITINVLFLAGILLSSDIASKYATVILTSMAGINGIIMTGDLFNLFVFMEITAISAYILTTSINKPRHSFNYLILGSAGSMLYLLGIALIYSMTGSLDMADVSQKAVMLENSSMIFPLTLIFAGLAVEAKIMPLAGWVKGIYSNADRMTATLFSSVFAAGILFVFGRLFADIFSVSGTLKSIMMVLCALTFGLGELAAFRQVKIKKILMFSSIAQSGLAAVLLLSGLVFPAVILIINNAVGKVILFSAACSMEEKYGTDEYKKLKGVFLNNIPTGIAFTAAALSIAGIPLFLGFYGKISSLYGLFELGDHILSALILLVTVIEGAYFIKMLIALWAPGEEGRETAAEHAVGDKKIFSMSRMLIVVIISLFILLSGILPGVFGDLISKDHRLLDQPWIVFDMSSSKGGE